MRLVRIGPNQFKQVPAALATGAAPLVPCRGCGGKTRLKNAYEVAPGLPDPIPGPILTPADAASPRQRERHAKAFEWVRRQLIPQPAPNGGDGVVVCGGGKYWGMIVASIRMLRESSAIPVQLWHRAAEEVRPLDLQGVPNVTYHVADSYPHRLLRRWEAKYLSLVHCGLTRALLLDADAYCLSDPPLLDLTSAPPQLAPDGVLVRHSYLAFWQDLHDVQQRMKWEGFGLFPSHAALCQPIQGGHVAVDLASPAWPVIVAAHWLNQHGDYFYRHGFGDQDMLRAAVAAARLDCTNLGMVKWDHPGYVCELNGVPLIVHASRRKLLIERTRHLPGDERFYRHVADWLRG